VRLPKEGKKLPQFNSLPVDTMGVSYRRHYRQSSPINHILPKTRLSGYIPLNSLVGSFSECKVNTSKLGNCSSYSISHSCQQIFFSLSVYHRPLFSSAILALAEPLLHELIKCCLSPCACIWTQTITAAHRDL